MAKQKMNKDIVPTDFTIGLALVDLIPVIFFLGIGIILTILTKNAFCAIGGAISFLGGLIKVIWKIIVVRKKKNIWPMFVQMRITMPLGFLFILVGLIMFGIKYDFDLILCALISMPSMLFFMLGVIGMVAMIVFSVKLDSADLKSNWIEQITNGIAQGFLFLGLLFLLL